jgi:DNA end-binding protein Ku
LRSWGNVIVLNQLRFQEEIRSTSSLKVPEASEAKAKEVEVAIKLINRLSGEFKPKKYKDTYVQDLKSIIEKKAKGELVHIEAKEPQPTQVKDLMTLLKASLKEDLKKAA